MNTKSKKIAVAAVAASLAGLMAVGGTLAWLTAGTEVKVNTFSVGANGTGGEASVSIQLKEDAFDGADYGAVRDVEGVLKTDFDAHYSVKDGVITNTLKDATYGYNQAQYILPGRVIAKDPQVKNNGQNAVYVAIKLDYKKNTAAAGEQAVYVDSSYAELLFDATKDGADKGIFEAIAFDTANWTAKDGTNTVFYYNTVLATGAETSELFEQVKIASKAAKVYGFQIDVTAYAVQAEGIDADNAPAMLDKTIDGTINA